MRALKPEEEEQVMKKLHFFIGDNTKEILKDSSLYNHKERVLLVSETLLKATSQISRKDLVSAGRIIGKFTKTGSFRITITAVNTLAEFALWRVWLKSSSEMNFLYGNNALKSHVQKLSENIPLNSGVFVFNHHNTPLGFGVMAVSPTSYARARGGDLAVLNQADNGLYIREERNVA